MGGTQKYNLLASFFSGVGVKRSSNWFFSTLRASNQKLSDLSFSFLKFPMIITCGGTATEYMHRQRPASAWSTVVWSQIFGVRQRLFLNGFSVFSCFEDFEASQRKATIQTTARLAQGVGGGARRQGSNLVKRTVAFQKFGFPPK